MTTETKSIPATQKAVDCVPLGSGTWRIEGIVGLYLRAHQTQHSFFIQRRVRGKLLKQTLGPLSMKATKERAMAAYSDMKPRPAAGDVMTLKRAFQGYLSDRKLAPLTVAKYESLFRTYLQRDWANISMADIGKDRAGVRQLYRNIKKRSPSRAIGVIKLIGALFSWAKGEEQTLPESPTIAVKLDKLASRDWALDDDGLRQWWAETQQCTRVVKMFRLTCLLTGARRGSVEPLEWSNINWDTGTLHFKVAKGGKAYSMPMSDSLIQLLREYRESIAPGERWLFPSPKNHGRHMADIAGRAHQLRHTFKTRAAALGIAELLADLLQGHTLGGVSRGYVTAGLLTEPLRNAANTISRHYATVLGLT